MRLGVLSDTHGKLNYAREAIKKLAPIDLLIHAGDHYHDAFDLQMEMPEKIPIEAVVGNCDFSEGPREKLLEIAGKKIFLTHGHKYNVKSSYQNIAYKGKEIGADLVIFGHTHMAEIIEVDGLVLFNPGSISRPRLDNRFTYGLIEIKEGKIFPHIFEIERI